MRLARGLLPVALACGLAAGCDDGTKPRPVDDEARRLISIEVLPGSWIAGGEPVGLLVTVYDLEGEPVAGEAVILESSRWGDSFSPAAGISDQRGEFVSALSGSGPGNRLVTAQVGGSKGSVAVFLTMPFCSGDLRVGGHGPVEIVDPGSQFGLFGAGDLDGDGTCDLAILSQRMAWNRDDPVNLLLRLAGGATTLRRDDVFADERAPGGVLIADFDGDGASDLALVSREGFPTYLAWIEWYSRSSPDWLAHPSHLFPAGLHFGAVKPIDLDGDGRSELLMERWEGGDVREKTYFQPMLWGEEGAYMGARVDLVAEDILEGWIAADFDGDGYGDVASWYQDVVFIEFGRGDGTIASRDVIPTRARPVLAADLDEDGRAELISVGYEERSDERPSAYVEVRWAASPYGEPSRAHLPTEPMWIRTGDFDGDGNLDLFAFVTEGADLELHVILGDGAGGIGEATFISRLPLVWSQVAVCDTSGSGRPDVVLLAGGALAVIPVDTLGPGLRSAHPIGRKVYVFGAGDLDGDGSVEVLTTTAFGLVRIFGVDDDGRLEPLSEEIPLDLPIGDLSGTGAVGPSDRDPIGTILTAHVDAGRELRLHSLSTGEWQRLATGLDFMASAAGDLDGAGLLDIAFTTLDETWALLAERDGSFRPELIAAVGGNSIAIADVDGDGSNDVVIGGNGEVIVVRLGAAGVIERHALEGADRIWFVTAGDFDGDGLADIAADGGTSTVAIFLHDESGTLLPARRYGVGTAPYAGAFGTLRGSGLPGLVVARSGDAALVQALPLTCDPAASP